MLQMLCFCLWSMRNLYPYHKWRYGVLPYIFYRSAHSCIHSLWFFPVQLKQSSRWRFFRRLFVSVTALHWIDLWSFLKKINSPLILYPHSSVPNNISFLLLFNGFFWWLRGFLSVHYLSASANCPNVYSC